MINRKALTKLETLFKLNIKALAASLDAGIQNQLNEYKTLQTAGLKGDLSYLYISFLLSGVLCQLPWLRIDLLDENDHLDLTECYVEWNVPAIAGHLYQSVEKMAKENDMKDYELEQAWLDAADEYFRAFERYLPAIIDEGRAVKKLGCKCYFGSLMGNTVMVGNGDQDEIF